MCFVNCFTSKFFTAVDALEGEETHKNEFLIDFLK